MERLHCPTCGHEVFFDSLRCVRCGTGLAHELRDGGVLVPADARIPTERGSAGACMMRGPWRCNWRPEPDVGRPALCPSCVLVDAGDHGNNPLLVAFLTAQRRALWQLAQLGVPWSLSGGAGGGPSGNPVAQPPLLFTYRSRSSGDEVSTGHERGEITLDLDEADPARREQIRATLGEQYRTPLGHLRHELGHYVWLRFVSSDHERLARFREVFGDETADYRAALDAHYVRDDDGSWRDQHVSFYASAHPWEDFAESWAQVMHIHDVVSTGISWGVIAAPSGPFDPDTWVSAAVTASLAANELARAMGVRDLYPFALSSGARRRIEASWELVRAGTTAGADGLPNFP